MSKEQTTPQVDQKSLKEVSIFERTANDLTINNAGDMEKAVEVLGSIKKMQKHLKTQETDAKKPYQELVKGIIAAFKPVNTQLTAAEDTIKGKIGAFRRKEAELAEAKKAKIEARVGEGKGKLKEQTAINQIANVEQNRSAAHIDTGTSKLTTRKVKKLNITDESLIPREFLVVDTAKLRKAAFDIYDLKSNGVDVAMVPGVEVTVEESYGAA